MMRTAFLAALGGSMLAGGVALTPAAAQSNDRVLIIYGKDPCPQSNGEEIVVCQRLDERERYRIPEGLRDSTPSPRNERWADRARSLEYVGASGTGTCSNSGQGSWTGCWSQLMKQAKADRQMSTQTADPK